MHVVIVFRRLEILDSPVDLSKVFCKVFVSDYLLDFGQVVGKLVDLLLDATQIYLRLLGFIDRGPFNWS